MKGCHSGNKSGSSRVYCIKLSKIASGNIGMRDLSSICKARKAEVLSKIVCMTRRVSIVLPSTGLPDPIRALTIHGSLATTPTRRVSTIYSEFKAVADIQIKSWMSQARYLY